MADKKPYIVLDHSALERLFKDGDMEFEVAVQQAALADIARRRVRLKIDETSDQTRKRIRDLVDLECKKYIDDKRRGLWITLNSKTAQMVRRAVQDSFESVLAMEMQSIREDLNATMERKAGEASASIEAEVKKYLGNASPDMVATIVKAFAKDLLTKQLASFTGQSGE